MTYNDNTDNVWDDDAYPGVKGTVDAISELTYAYLKAFEIDPFGDTIPADAYRRFVGFSNELAHGDCEDVPELELLTILNGFLLRVHHLAKDTIEIKRLYTIQASLKKFVTSQSRT